MSAKALAQDMYIEELEGNLSDAARIMLEDGCHGDESQMLTAWLNAAAERATYAHKHRTHIQVSYFRPRFDAQTEIFFFGKNNAEYAGMARHS